MEWSTVRRLSHQINHRGPSSLVQHRFGWPLLNRLLPRKGQFSASVSTHRAQNWCHNPCNSDTLHLDSFYIWLRNLFQCWFLEKCVLLHCKVELNIFFIIMTLTWLHRKYWCCLFSAQAHCMTACWTSAFWMLACFSPRYEESIQCWGQRSCRTQSSRAHVHESRSNPTSQWIDIKDTENV